MLLIPKPHFGLEIIYFKRFCFIQSYDKRNDCDFDIVNSLFWMSTCPFLCFYNSQINRFAILSSHLTMSDINPRNKTLTTKLLNMGVGMINSGHLFLSFIAYTANWFLIMIPDKKKTSATRPIGTWRLTQSRLTGLLTCLIARR